MKRVFHILKQDIRFICHASRPQSLKQTRDGLEDWEMFKIASGVAGEDAVKEAVSKAYTQLGTAPVLGIWNPLSPPWTRDGKVIDEVRKEVAALITE